MHVTGVRKAEEHNLNFVMVKIDPLYTVLHNIRVYKSVTMMLKEGLLHFPFPLKTRALYSNRSKELVPFTLT